MPPTIPSGPAWAVAIGMIFTGLALLIRAATPAIQAIRKNGHPANGPARFQANGEAERRTNNAVRELIGHLDKMRDMMVANQQAILADMKETRHDILAPVKIIISGMQEELARAYDRVEDMSTRLDEIHRKVGA